MEAGTCLFSLCIALHPPSWLSKHLLLLRWRLGARPGDDLA